MALARPLTKAAASVAGDSSPQSTSTSGTTPNNLDRVTLAEALSRWETHLHASERIGSARTITTYKYGVGKLVDSLGGQRPLLNIQHEDIEALLASLKAAGMTPGGRAVVYRPIRTFFKWCVARGLLLSSPVEGIAVPKAKAQPVEFVTDVEFKNMIGTTSTKSRWAFRARRDRAILLLMATTGLRLSEVSGIQLQDVDLVQRCITVHGKGGKDRLVPILPDAMEALQAYLTLERPRSPFSGATDALWLSPRGALTSSGVAQLVAERAKEAGIARRVHPHELRHRFAANALAGGMPGPLLMQLAGWSSPAMLTRYGAHSRQEDAMAYLRGMAAKV